MPGPNKGRSVSKNGQVLAKLGRRNIGDLILCKITPATKDSTQ